MKRKGLTYVNTENSFPKLSGWYGKVDGHDNVGCGGGVWYAVTIRWSSVRIFTDFCVLTRSVSSWYIHTNAGCCSALSLCVWNFWPPFVVTEVPYFTFDTISDSKSLSDESVMDKRSSPTLTRSSFIASHMATSAIQARVVHLPPFHRLLFLASIVCRRLNRLRCVLHWCVIGVGGHGGGVWGKA